VRPLEQADLEGDAAHPTSLAGAPVAAQLRIRRDVPGALVALEDGRYAVVGPLVAVGGRQSLATWATRRLRRLDGGDPERAWLQNVVGALAADVPE
jgi:potassium/hydrogen antiporter